MRRRGLRFRFPGILLPILLWASVPAAALPASQAPAWELAVAGGGKVVPVPIPDGGFELSWTHSVERTVWRERYRVDPSGGIVLVASEFSSAGAGLPDRLAEGETFRLAGGKMRIEGRSVRVGDLRLRLSGASRHLLRAGDRTVDLNDRFGEGVVTLRVERHQPKGDSR